MHIVVRRAHIRGICIRQIPLLRRPDDFIRRHLIVATRLQGRYTLTEYEWLAREVLRHILHPLVVVVEADNINDATLEEMIVGTGLVAAREDGAPRGIIAFDDVCQMYRQDGVRTEFTVLGQRRGIMGSIQDEIGLF